VGDLSAARWRRRRYLSDDVRQRTTVTSAIRGDEASLPLAQPPARTSGMAATQMELAAAPAIVQPQRDEESGDETRAPASASPSPQQVADRVYQLLREDLRLDRERIGW